MNFGDNYTLMGWSREEWLLAKRWAQGLGKDYLPTLDGAAQLQSDWRTAHMPPPKPEDIWFNRLIGTAKKAMLL